MMKDKYYPLMLLLGVFLIILGAAFKGFISVFVNVFFIVYCLVIISKTKTYREDFTIAFAFILSALTLYFCHYLSATDLMDCINTAGNSLGVVSGCENNGYGLLSKSLILLLGSILAAVNGLRGLLHKMNSK
jgi:hypothetical protein